MTETAWASVMRWKAAGHLEAVSENQRHKVRCRSAASRVDLQSTHRGTSGRATQFRGAAVHPWTGNFRGVPSPVSGPAEAVSTDVSLARAMQRHQAGRESVGKAYIPFVTAWLASAFLDFNQGLDRHGTQVAWSTELRGGANDSRDFRGVPVKKASLALAAFAIAAGAQAATVTFEYGPSNVLVAPEFTHAGSLGLFDSNLGTLTGAVLLVRGRYQQSVGGTNTSLGSQSVEVLSQILSSWDSSLDALDSFVTELVGFSYSNGTQGYAPGETKSFTFGPNTAGYVDDLGSCLLYTSRCV